MVTVIRIDEFANNSAIYAVGIVFQFVTIVAIARLLGPDDFGRYSIYVVLCMVAVEVLALGSGDLLIRESATRPQRYAPLFGHSLLLGGLALLPCTIVVTATALMFGIAEAHYALIAAIVAVETASGRIAILCEQALIGRLRPGRANWLRLYVNAARAAAAALALLLIPHLDLVAWLAIQSATSAVSAACALYLVSRSLGAPRLAFRARLVTAGLPFSATQIVRMLQLQIDRLLVVFVAPAPIVGLYAAASRIITLGALPMVTLLRMTYPHFFVEGKRGMRGALPFGLKVLAGLLAIASIVASLFMVAAPLLPWLLGDGYRDAVPLAQSLAPICFAYAFYYAGGDLLSGTGHQGLRFIATLLNLACIAAGILAFGSDGAQAIVVAVLMGNFLGAMLTWLFLLFVWLRDRPGDAA